MSSLFFEIVTIFLLILLNGVLAMSEIAVVSARKVRLQQRAVMGNAGAQAALDLANSPNHFLSTVQIGITLVGILAGAFGGATLADKLADWFNRIPLLADYSEVASVALVVLVITYLSLILGELAPKQIGLNNPEGIAAAIALPMKRLSRLAAPVVHLLSLSSNAILRLLGVRPSSEPEVTEEEIRLLIAQATEGGVFAPAEEEMVEQVFRLADRRLVSLMTPRTEIVWLDLDDSTEAMQAKLVSSQHNYLPVAQGTLDNLLGWAQAKDLLAQSLNCQPLDLLAVLRSPLILPESLPVFDALERFRANNTQAAFVLDEYGGIQGLVTATDILEAIVGDLPDSSQVEEPDIIQREDGTWLLDGRLHVDDFKDLFDLVKLPEEEDGDYQTLGGFVMTVLGRVPAAGDHFELERLRLEVVDMDGLRVDKVLVAPIAE